MNQGKKTIKPTKIVFYSDEAIKKLKNTACKTIEVLQSDSESFFLDRLKNGTFRISRDEKTLHGGLTLKRARELWHQVEMSI